MRPVVEGNGRATGVVYGEWVISRTGLREDPSTSTIFDDGKHSSLWGTERRSMTMLEALMEGGETDKGCRDWVGGALAGWWMTLSFTSAFVKCRMCFRKG